MAFGLVEELHKGNNSLDAVCAKYIDFDSQQRQHFHEKVFIDFVLYMVRNRVHIVLHFDHRAEHI